MDFFQRQEDARRRTFVLIGGYAAAVMLTVGAVYVVLAALLRDGDNGWWQPGLFLAVTLALGLAIVGGTLFKVASLSGGGGKVAAMLGAREVPPETSDPDERRLRNIVEEMAIASGLAPPPVFVVDTEEGINAFAAGFRSGDAVIGVTRGCLQRLSRDELQGVIAHEFSHILNGDMRLNIRLIGILHGLLMIHLLGRIILRTMMYSGGHRSRRRSGSGGKSGGQAVIFIFAAGTAMLIIGAIGVFFGRVIKSAVSRQREYLADASAVQFTRNPAGLAGALKRIGAVAGGSRIRDPHAEEMSHLFFANGLAPAWLGLMASHPPLKERVRRLDPAFDGDFSRAARPASARPPASPPAETGNRDEDMAVVAGLAVAAAAAARPREIAVRPEELSASIGALGAGQLDAARAILAELSAAVRERLHNPAEAAAAVLALLYSGNPQAAALQRKVLESAGESWLARMDAMRESLRDLDSSARLAVIDLALPALQRLTPDDYRGFRKWCRDFVAADGEISIFEYALLGIIERHLAESFGKTRPPTAQYYALKPLAADALVLLGVLARFGNTDDPAEAARVFRAGLAELDAAMTAELPAAAECSLEAFDRALRRFRLASLPLRRRMLGACAVCAAANGRISVDEANLLRAVADAFDAPMPPLTVKRAA